MSNKYLAKRDLDTVCLDNIEPERKAQIMDIKNSIAFNYDSTLDYASEASKNLTEFSSDLLKTVKVKDTPEVEGMIGELLSGLEQVDASTLTTKKPTFLGKLFGVDSSNIKRFIAKYEDVAGVIDTVKEKMEVANFQLKKDIALCDRYLQQNMEFICQLEDYIMAGKLRLQEEQAEIDAARAVVDESDQLAVYDLNNRQSEVDRFDRKISNLLLIRMIAVQNIPQLLLIKNGDSILIEKIESSINTAIPLWESQMVIAIQLMRQKGALALEKAVTQTTNNLIAKNGEMLREGSISVAQSLETGIVDVETLKKNSENLIQTMQAIKKIQADGKQKRIEATRELGQLQIKLNEQMLLGDGTK